MTSVIESCEEILTRKQWWPSKEKIKK